MIRTLHHVTKAYRKVCNHLTTRSQERKINIPQQLQVVAGKKNAKISLTLKKCAHEKPQYIYIFCFKPRERDRKRNLQANDIQRRNIGKVKYISYNNVVVTSLQAHIDVFPISALSLFIDHLSP